MTTEVDRYAQLQDRLQALRLQLVEKETERKMAAEACNAIEDKYSISSEQELIALKDNTIQDYNNKVASLSAYLDEAESYLQGM
jgi:multidrug resistance efflux pump